MTPIDITKDFRKQERRQRWRERREKAFKWCSDHKELVVGGAIAGLGLLKTGLKIGGKIHVQNMERRNKDLRVYDTSLGKYWELKHKLKNRDWLEIERRKANGERLGEILNDLNVLK